MESEFHEFELLYLLPNPPVFDEVVEPDCVEIEPTNRQSCPVRPSIRTFVQLLPSRIDGIQNAQTHEELSTLQKPLPFAIPSHLDPMTSQKPRLETRLRSAS